jgi:predicted DNA-binding ribbon-helix-helix protein
MKKRSITIAGHRTSLSLEEAFWVELKRLADQEGLSLSALITRIDARRDLKINLSSALRLYVLEQVKRHND